MFRNRSGGNAVPGEPQVTKSLRNVFTATKLPQVLARRKVTDVIVCGIRAEQCAEQRAQSFHAFFMA
jgi:nicotinamidase-related amidase